MLLSSAESAQCTLCKGLLLLGLVTQALILAIQRALGSLLRLLLDSKLAASAAAAARPFLLLTVAALVPLPGAGGVLDGLLLLTGQAGIMPARVPGNALLDLTLLDAAAFAWASEAALMLP